MLHKLSESRRTAAASSRSDGRSWGRCNLICFAHTHVGIQLENNLVWPRGTVPFCTRQRGDRRCFTIAEARPLIQRGDITPAGHVNAGMNIQKLDFCTTSRHHKEGPWHFNGLQRPRAGRLPEAMTLPTHPYFPLDLALPSYVPMQVGFDYILGVFFTAVLLVFGLTWNLAGEMPAPESWFTSCLRLNPCPWAAARHPKLTNVERLLACWFMITGLIHFVIEGWVVVKADFFKDASGNYLSDTCRRCSFSGFDTCCTAELCMYLSSKDDNVVSMTCAACRSRTHASTPPHPPPHCTIVIREGVQQG